MMGSGCIGARPGEVATGRTLAVTVGLSQQIRDPGGLEYQGPGGTDEHVSAHCRVWVLVQLRAELPGCAKRRRRVAVPATPGLPERVRGAAGPGRWHLPVRPQQYPGAAASQVRPGDDGAGNHLADPPR